MGRKVPRDMSVKLVMRRLRELTQFIRQEDGQALVEYALLVSLIALVAFGAINFFGLGVSQLYSKVNANWP
jgi:Flp pilus assembly pilin Flp